MTWLRASVFGRAKAYTYDCRFYSDIGFLSWSALAAHLLTGSSIMEVGFLFNWTVRLL